VAGGGRQLAPAIRPGNMHGMDEAAADPLVGTLLGSCVIERQLGSGAMGHVYEATDRHLRRRVAVKMLRPDLYAEKEARMRFEREAASAAAIEHENVVRVYSIDVDPEGRPYIVMEFVEGSNLSELVHEGALPHDRALRIFAEVAAALQAVHEHGVVHRDVKPANIMLRDVGSPQEQALLTDFGIAKVLDSNTVMTAGPIGTYEYMSPEVVDYGEATARSDQYALAAVLYRMLSGELLYEGMEMPRAHRDEPLPDLSQLLPSANRALRAALARALEKDPGERFPSVAAFAEAVRESQESQPSARLPLQQSMEEVLAESGPLSPHDLAERINDGLDMDDVGVTELQVDGRARLFSQLFHRRPDGKIELRD
jgi:eukaryotic-like serine/threonine-protein kinase